MLFSVQSILQWGIDRIVQDMGKMGKYSQTSVPLLYIVYHMTLMGSVAFAQLTQKCVHLIWIIFEN